MTNLWPKLDNFKPIPHKNISLTLPYHGEAEREVRFRSYQDRSQEKPYQSLEIFSLVPLQIKTQYVE